MKKYVVYYSGNIFTDAGILQERAIWREPVNDVDMNQAGETLVDLDGAREHCRLKECNLGKEIVDSGNVNYIVTIARKFKIRCNVGDKLLNKGVLYWCDNVN